MHAVMTGRSGGEARVREAVQAQQQGRELSVRDESGEGQESKEQCGLWRQ
jgi:hypothetical protein